MFFALPGRRTHGVHHIDAALAAGAAAVVAPAGAAACTRPRLIEVNDVLDAIGRAAHRFHGTPSADLDVIGVTGTNGKTTVTHCIARAFQAIDPGARCAVVGTLGHGVPGGLRDASLTTPDVLDVHRLLAEMRRSGVRRVAMEVSSHGIDQGRVAGVRLRVACLTNLARDHLDYHPSAAAYAAAKRRLFSWPGLGAAVVNTDDRLGRAILQSSDGPARRLGYALEDRDAAVRGRLDGGRTDGIRLEVEHGGRRAILESPLVGRFNAYNLLAAVAVLLALEVPLPLATAGLAAADAPRGRLQRVDAAESDGSGPAVFVDYAHTPDALDAVLRSLRTFTRGEIRIVFGCGGGARRGQAPSDGRGRGAWGRAALRDQRQPPR